LVIGVKVQNKNHKIIKDIIKWIKNVDMEFILGKMDGAIREIFKMIIEMDMENYILMKEN